ncbi:lyase family protein [Amaricoccus solimangrovi]|nr:lyase family protein [Amaricoccus solimangrovi]
MFSPFDDPLTARLYGDPEVAALFATGAALRAMLRVEGALAAAEGALGIIPAESARAIAGAAETVTLDPEAIGEGMAEAGVPVPALVAGFRAALPKEHGAWLHWGATSQDIVDTGLALRLRDLCDLVDARLATLIAAFADQAARHRGTVMAARTRNQIATPTTLGAKIAVWAAPLLTHRERLAELRPRLLRVSLAGASGTNAALAGRGPEVMRALAAGLGLEPSEIPWHADRAAMAEFGAFLALVSGSLGKIGTDLILLGQSEVGEVRAGAGGGSSTMPQKSNPVSAEALVTLARVAGSQVGALYAAMPGAQERDGAAWPLEWFALPALAAAAGAGLRIAADLATSLRADPARMARALMADGGLMMAEAATFALAARMPRPEAAALVKAAVARVRDQGGTLAEALPATPGIDWPAVLDPATQTGDAGAIVDAFLARARG